MNVHLIWIIDNKSSTVVPHTHDFYQMIFCKKNGGLISVGYKVFEAKQGYAYFVTPGTIHSITQRSDMKTIDLKFFVQDSELQEYLSNIPEEFQLGDIAFMKMLFLFIAREGIESKIYCNETTNCALKLLLAKMIHEFNDVSVSAPHDYQVFYSLPEQVKSNTDVMILNLKEYIEENLHKDIRLEELASKVNLNKTYFVKRFKILFGISPIKYILNMRIEKSKKMIIDGKLSIQQISGRVGFNSIHYFSAAFKSSEGMSPTDYYKYFNSK